MTVLAMSTARNNAELIVQAAELGYLHKDWVTVDPTWGEGKFWTAWRPKLLLASDLDPAKCPLGVLPLDFTDLPYADGSMDAFVFDPPYKLNGTSTALGPSASDAAYGVAGPYRTWQQRHQLIRDGTTEGVRVLKPKTGMLLVKCQDQVCSGRKRWQTIEFSQHAVGLGCELVDMLHLAGRRAQPPGRRQVHAHQNFSTLLVLRKLATP